MTSPNPMALEAIGNFDVGAYVEDYEFRGDDGDYVPTASERELLVDAISGVLHELHKTAKTVAALPLPAAGEGLEPVAWRWRWSKYGSNTAWHFSPVKPGPFAEEGYEVQPLYAATPDARAAVLEEAAQAASDVIRGDIAAPSGALMVIHFRVLAAIRALKEKT